MRLLKYLKFNTMTDNKKALLETLKFALRMALLIGLPMVAARAVWFTGETKAIFDVVFPIILPIVDKWVHEDPRIPIRGISPF